MNKNKMRICSNFKSINENISAYNKNFSPSCRECVYFSSRNCGMDIADSIDPEIDFFY